MIAEGTFYEIDEPGSGTAPLYQLADGSRALRLEDFEVFLNTDLVVWLSQAAAPRTSEEAVSVPHVEIAPLKSTMGPQTTSCPPTLRSTSPTVTRRRATSASRSSEPRPAGPGSPRRS